MSSDLDLKKLQVFLKEINEDPDDYHPHLTNICLEMVKRVFSLRNVTTSGIEKFKSDFHLCKSDKEKITFIYEKPSVIDELYKIVEEIISDDETYAKNNTKAEKFMIEGNEKMSKQKYDEALWYFSRAINCSKFPKDKQHVSRLGELFFARAEVLHQLKRYSDCLKDIENGEEFGLLPQKYPKVLLLKIKCSKYLGELQLMSVEAREELINALEEYEASINDAKLTEEIVDLIEAIKDPYGTRTEVNKKKAFLIGDIHNGSNNQIANASKSLCLETDEKGENCLRCAEKVPGNSNIIIEKPYSSVLTLFAYRDYCYHCFKALDEVFYPCSTCNKVSFCSKDCFNNALQYHQSECKYLPIIADSDAFKLALRTILVSGVEKSIETYKYYCENEQSNANSKHINDAYLRVLRLTNHSDQLAFINSFAYTLISISFTLLLNRNTNLLKSFTKNDQQVFAEILLMHIKQAIFNGTDIMVNEVTRYGLSIDGTKIGLGFYSTVGLLSYSCDSNVTPVFSNLKLFMKTKRALEKGEKLTLSHGYNRTHESKEMRRKQILREYLYTCNCSACNDDIEKYRDALLCPKCCGPVIYNMKELTCICFGCNENNTITDLKKTLTDLKTNETNLHYVVAYYQMKHLNNPRDSFEKIYQNLRTICYKDNQFLLQIMDILANFYHKTNDLPAAINLAKEIYASEEKLFGIENIYVLYRLVKITVWQWEAYETSANSDLNEYNKLKDETEKIVKKVEKTLKEKEQNGSCLISTNLVNCRNELQLLATKN